MTRNVHDDVEDDGVASRHIRPISLVSVDNGHFPMELDSSSDQVRTDVCIDGRDILDSKDLKDLYRQSDSINSQLSALESSQTNLGYTESGSEGSLASTGWTWQKSQESKFRRDSKSFIDKTRKFVRRSRERLSLTELNRTRAGVEELRQPKFFRLVDDVTSPVPARQERFSYVEDTAASEVNVPPRPMSAMQGSSSDSIGRSFLRSGRPPSAGSLRTRPRSSVRTSEDSLRTSCGYDENIDWSWLDEASAALSRQAEEVAQLANLPQSSTMELPRGRSSSPPNGAQAVCCQAAACGCKVSSSCDEVARSDNEASCCSDALIRAGERFGRFEAVTPTDSVRSSNSSSVQSSRADAECQTSSDHTESCWDGGGGGDERLRGASAAAAHSGRSSRCETVVAIGHAMLHKPEDEAGPSGCGSGRSVASRTESGPRPNLPSWLRASMRRVTHFNLDPPSDRPASAPAAAGRRPPSPPPPAPPPMPAAEESDGYVSDSTDRQTSAGQRSVGRGEAGSSWEGRSPLGPWPHGLSSVLALLGCTLGLFNISRFAILSVHFGGNFIVQFLILSVVLGIPLFAFHTALGQTLGAGPVDMWSISPVFQGIGIAMLFSQALVGIYSVVGVSWMFVYFRDSFITKQDTYRWAEPFKLYREDTGEIPGQFFNSTLGRLDQTVPDYLNGVVLQRHGLNAPASAFGNLKFQLTFNLAVIWMVVFVSLSKGLRSYGKVVYVFSLLPVLGIFVLASKLLGLTPMRHGLFPHTDWNDFFFNTRSWVSAATEVTLTFNLLGAAAMQVTSHNKTSKRLWRDVAVVVLITLFVLILAAFLANTCHQILTLKYSYIPSSFESMNSYAFLRPMGASLPPYYATPLRALPHASLVAGDRIGKPGAVQESGYQVVRLATELMPAMLAMLGADLLSPFWAVLFYFTLILFGIAQQLAIWHCVITGILAINTNALKSWETTITFFACAAGFILGLPMTTELGVFVVYFLDYCMGGGWWVLAVTLTQLCAVFMLRGRPYTGEFIAQALFGKNLSCVTYWAVPLLTFAWNVIMPVAVLGVCITVFRSGGYRDMWVWRNPSIRAGYWPHWARQLGVLIQLTPLLCIPVTAIIQTYRYLSTGPPDILDRLSNLYRPSSGLHSRPMTAAGARVPSSTTQVPEEVSSETSPPSEDPPPKYTPPPSYSTATGVRIAKMLRQSFRRSMRRLQAALEPAEPTVLAPRPPPPDYTSVLVEMNHETASPTHQIPYTAQDVANVLRSSFRRSGPPTSRTISTAPTSLTNLSNHNSMWSAPSSLTNFVRQSQDSASEPASLIGLPCHVSSEPAKSLTRQVAYEPNISDGIANVVGESSTWPPLSPTMAGLSPATTVSSLNSP